MAIEDAARRYAVSQDGNEYVITDGSQVVETPMGIPLRTRFKDLAEEIADDIERDGTDVTDGVNMYICLCSCLDFVPRVGKKGLVVNILPAFREDPVLNMSADPDVMCIQMAAFSQPYFAANGILEKSSDELIGWAVEEMMKWSIQEIMVVQLAGANIRSPLMGMALARDEADLEAAAIGFCGRFWQHMADSHDGAWFGATPRFYPNPSRVDNSFCRSNCLQDSDREKLKTNGAGSFRDNCGVVTVLDVWRRFAAYGRQPPPPEDFGSDA